MAVLEAQETRICLRCKRRQPIDCFPVLVGDHRSVRCERCTDEAERRTIDRSYVLPDPEPARALRVELARCRKAGLPWTDELFEKVITYATSEVPEANDWRRVLLSHRAWWRIAYERSGSITSLTP